jgi:hypothetical protein
MAEDIFAVPSLPSPRASPTTRAVSAAASKRQRSTATATPPLFDDHHRQYHLEEEGECNSPPSLGRVQSRRSHAAAPHAPTARPLSSARTAARAGGAAHRTGHASAAPVPSISKKSVPTVQDRTGARRAKQGGRGARSVPSLSSYSTAPSRASPSLCSPAEQLKSTRLTTSRTYAPAAGARRTPPPRASTPATTGTTARPASLRRRAAASTASTRTSGRGAATPSTSAANTVLPRSLAARGTDRRSVDALFEQPSPVVRPSLRTQTRSRSAAAAAVSATPSLFASDRASALGGTRRRTRIITPSSSAAAMSTAATDLALRSMQKQLFTMQQQLQSAMGEKDRAVAAEARKREELLQLQLTQIRQEQGRLRAAEHEKALRQEEQRRRELEQQLRLREKQLAEMARQKSLPGKSRAANTPGQQRTVTRKATRSGSRSVGSRSVGSRSVGSRSVAPSALTSSPNSDIFTSEPTGVANTPRSPSPCAPRRAKPVSGSASFHYAHPWLRSCVLLCVCVCIRFAVRSCAQCA